MEELRFLMPAYDRAMLRFTDQVVKGFFAVEPFFGRVPWHPIEHAGPIRNVRAPSPLDQTMPMIEAVSSVEIDTIRNADIEAYTAFLYKLADSNTQAIASELPRTIREVTEAVGSSFNGTGEPFFNLLNDML